MEKEKYIGESPIQGKPKKKILFRIPEKAIKNKHLDDRSVDERVLALKSVGIEHLKRDIQKALDEKVFSVVYSDFVPRSDGEVVIQTGPDWNGFKKGHHYKRTPATFYKLKLVTQLNGVQRTIWGWTSVRKEDFADTNYMYLYGIEDGEFTFLGYSEKQSGPGPDFLFYYEGKYTVVEAIVQWEYCDGTEECSCCEDCHCDESCGCHNQADPISGFTWEDITPGLPAVITDAEMDEVLEG